MVLRAGSGQKSERYILVTLHFIDFVTVTVGRRIFSNNNIVPLPIKQVVILELTMTPAEKKETLNQITCFKIFYVCAFMCRILLANLS